MSFSPQGHRHRAVQSPTCRLMLQSKPLTQSSGGGAIAVAKAAARHIKPGGSITLTSGFLARRTVPGTYVKTAMNAALEAVAKILAKELAPIRVNVVSPGLTDTEAYADMTGEARLAMFNNAAKSLPARKVGCADDLAAGYLFAIDNPFVTGAVIDIDGGALIN